jgi:hypothetical protein
MSRSRAEQSRINGSKSRGPKTQEGKQRSSQNACKHGLTAQKFVLLESEHGDDGFDRLLQAFIARFEPADEVEYDLVFEAAAARWKLRRAWAIEVSTFEHKIEDQRDWVDDKFVECTDQDRLTLAFGWLSSDNVILTLNRYQTRIRREFERALRDLEYLRSGRIKPPVVGQVVGQVQDLRRAPRPASAELELPNEPSQPPPFQNRDRQGVGSSQLPNEPEMPAEKHRSGPAEVLKIVYNHETSVGKKRNAQDPSPGAGRCTDRADGIREYSELSTGHPSDYSEELPGLPPAEHQVFEP